MSRMLNGMRQAGKKWVRPFRHMSSAPPTTIRGEELTSSGNFLTKFLTKHKESIQVASYLSAVFVAVSGGLYFCGQLIGEFNSSRTAMAIIALEHSKDKELFSEKLQNEKDLRLKDKEIADVKLSNALLSRQRSSK